MSKHNYLVTFLKKINLLINTLLKKYLNKLKFNNPHKKILKFLKGSRVIFSLILLLFLGFIYLSIPLFFNKSELEAFLKNQLSKQFDLNFNFSKGYEYKFYPNPNITFKDVSILNNEKNIADIKNFNLNLSLKNLYSLNKLKIKSIIFNESNFNFYKQDADFFIALLEKNFFNTNIRIINSNIFFKSFNDEVLFINKIKKINYYYDKKKLLNTLYSENEIFNFPYTLEIQNDKIKEKFYSKLNLNILKLKIENEFNYANDIKNGLISSVYNKNKSKVNYSLDKNTIRFDFLDSSLTSKFNIKGKIKFKPFIANLSGNINKVNLSKLINSNSFLIQFLKTEILNNKNLTFEANVNFNKILPYRSFENLLVNFRIKEGLIDVDNTKFNWLDSVNFQVVDSLVYLKENNLVLDGKLILDIFDYDEIYKSFQTPRNYRSELKKIEADFNYNFDQQILNLDNLKIDGQINKKINEILNEFVIKETSLQNKIYLKNLINKAIKNYAG